MHRTPDVRRPNQSSDTMMTHVRAGETAPGAVVESPLQVSMVSQCMRPMPGVAEHVPRLVRQGPHRRSGCYSVSVRCLPRDAVYRAARDGRHGPQ